MMNGSEMGILEHLDELRQRLFRAVVALAIGVVISALFLTPQALKWLVGLLDEQIPVALAPTEAPAAFFKVSVVIGLAVSMPFILIELFLFLAPGLTRQERRYLFIGAPVAALSFAVGVFFAARVLLPAAISFLGGFLQGIIEHRYSINRYISFASNVLLWSGLVFETPLVMFLLAKLGVVGPQGFAGARRAVVVAAAAGAAVITPTTDPVNMLLIMVPFLVLYELGILLARLAQ